MLTAYRISEKRRTRLLLQACRFPGLFEPRHPLSHKGTYGTLAVLGGAVGMSGAAVLASVSAMYAGCGKVWAGFHQENLPFAVIPGHFEVMLDTASHLLDRAGISAWAVGCGLGQDESAAWLLERVLTEQTGKTVLLDADALNILSANAACSGAAKRHGNLILTPHPTEAARLLGVSTEEVQADRESAVEALSRRFNAVAVLKGHGTLVAAPEQKIYTNQSGHSGLATAGSGDVLSGIIGSLAAQGLNPFEAACAGVWMHGAAAEVITETCGVVSGMLAGELAEAARWIRNELSVTAY